MTTKKQMDIAIMEMLLCAALWSTAGIFIKKIPWNPFVIAGIRSAFSGLVMFAYMRASHIPFVLNRKSALSGAFLGMTFICFVAANKLTTAANAIVLQFTNPMFILIISSVFLKKKFSKADFLAVAFTMAGISLFFFDQLSAGHLLGNLVGIVSGMTFAAFFVTNGGSGDEERMSAILFAHMMTAALSLPFIAVTKPEVSLVPAVYIILLGVFQLGIPYVLLGLASGHCPPLVCSLLGAVEPLLNPVWVYLFDGEAPGAFALMGGALVIATITIWCVYNDRKAKTACRTI